MAGSRAPFHFGGPLGVAGLVLLAGAAGLFTVAGGASLSPAVVAGGDAKPVDAPATQPVPAVIEKSPAPETSPDVRVDPANVSKDTPETPLKPTPAKQEQPDRTQPLPAAAVGAEVTFIVRIKGSDDADVIARNFKRDPDAANSAYANLVRRSPELGAFDLVGASYSGDLKLAYRFAPGNRATPDAIDSVRQKILSVEGVAYADPDRVAHPGKDPR